MSVGFKCPLTFLLKLYIKAMSVFAVYSLIAHIVQFGNEPYPKAVLIGYGSVACAEIYVLMVAV